MSSLTVPAKETTAVTYAVALVLPVTVISEMNRRDHWATRRRRFDKQADAVFKALDAMGWYSDVTGYVWPFGFPVVVTLTRLFNRGVKMDDDNLRGAFKAVRDQVAEWAGVDDGADQIEWRYGQREGKPGIEVRIEGTK